MNTIHLKCTFLWHTKQFIKNPPLRFSSVWWRNKHLFWLLKKYFAFEFLNNVKFTLIFIWKWTLTRSHLFCIATTGLIVNEYKAHRRQNGIDLLLSKFFSVSRLFLVFGKGRIGSIMYSIYEVYKITVDNWCHNNAVLPKYLSEDISSCIFQIFPLAIHLSEVMNHHGCHLHPFISGIRPISNYSFSLCLQMVSCFTLHSIWVLSQVRVFQLAGMIQPGTFLKKKGSTLKWFRHSVSVTHCPWWLGFELWISKFIRKNMHNKILD